MSSSREHDHVLLVEPLYTVIPQNLRSNRVNRRIPLSLEQVNPVEKILRVDVIGPRWARYGSREEDAWRETAQVRYEPGRSRFRQVFGYLQANSEIEYPIKSERLFEVMRQKSAGWYSQLAALDVIPVYSPSIQYSLCHELGCPWPDAAANIDNALEWQQRKHKRHNNGRRARGSINLASEKLA
jgi:hypothetical protein